MVLVLFGEECNKVVPVRGGVHSYYSLHCMHSLSQWTLEKLGAHQRERERERANSLVGLSQSQPSSFLREAALLFSLPSRAELIKLIIIHFKSSHFRVIIIIIKLIIIFIYYVIDNLDCCLFCRCSLFCSLKRPTRWGMGKKRKGGGDMMVGARRVLIQKL